METGLMNLRVSLVMILTEPMEMLVFSTLMSTELLLLLILLCKLLLKQ
ncbi:hypothetical protein SDC9_210148 [bioreactor metagenome]|uniref:Uncharacterized protein n=1 Tax=bioreactor metagenome TaxID=1076179 RepID=A0A645JFL9_9ZZZZ